MRNALVLTVWWLVSSIYEQFEEHVHELEKERGRGVAFSLSLWSLSSIFRLIFRLIMVAFIHFRLIFRHVQELERERDRLQEAHDILIECWETLPKDKRSDAASRLGRRSVISIKVPHHG